MGISCHAEMVFSPSFQTLLRRQNINRHRIYHIDWQFQVQKSCNQNHYSYSSKNNCQSNTRPSPNFTRKNYAPPDELEAITNLQAIILDNNKNGQTKDKTVETVNVPTPIYNYNPNKEPTFIPTKEKMYIKNTPTLGIGLPSPAIISQDDVEDTQNCYSLRSRAQ